MVELLNYSILVLISRKNQLTGKDPDAGKDWRQKEKGVAEHEMIRQHHRLNGHEFEPTIGANGGQRSLGLQSVGLQRVDRS